METTKELIIVAKTHPNGLYDFIANNGHRLDRHELVRLSMELAYALYREQEHQDGAESLVEGLETHWGE